MKTRIVLQGLLLLGLVACGGGSSASGTVGGKPLNVVEAVFVRYSADSLFVLLSDTGDTCTRMQQRQRLSGRTLLLMSLGTYDSDPNASSPPITPGTFPVNQGADNRRAAAIFDKFDASCVSEFGINEGPSAGGGTVNLSSFSANVGGTATGTFELHFESDRLKGNFNATYCDNGIISGERGRVCSR